jgi:hypothetical protein
MHEEHGGHGEQEFLHHHVHGFGVYLEFPNQLQLLVLQQRVLLQMHNLAFGNEQALHHLVQHLQMAYGYHPF